MRTYALLVAGKTDYLGQFLPINTSLLIMEAFRDGGLKSSLEKRRSGTRNERCGRQKDFLVGELDVAKSLRHCGALVAPQWSNNCKGGHSSKPIQNVPCNILKIYVTKWYN